MAILEPIDTATQLTQAFLNIQDIVFERGNICVCGTKKYRLLVNNIVRCEACPECEGDKKIIDLVKGD